VLKDFQGRGPGVQVVSWMESPNAFLARRRPREAIEHAPQEVLAALAERRRGGLNS